MMHGCNTLHRKADKELKDWKNKITDKKKSATKQDVPCI